MNDFYCVAVAGMDNVYAVSSLAEAYRISQEMNAIFIDQLKQGDRDNLYPIIWASPARWDYGEELHSKDIKSNGSDWTSWPS